MSTCRQTRRLCKNVSSDSFAVDIEWEKRGNLFFPGEDKSAHAGKSISWLAARPARDRTSRYAFYNIFPSQFPFAHRREESKVPLEREKEKEREIHFHEYGCNFNPLKKLQILRKNFFWSIATRNKFLSPFPPVSFHKFWRLFLTLQIIRTKILKNLIIFQCF